MPRESASSETSTVGTAVTIPCECWETLECGKYLSQTYGPDHCTSSRFVVGAVFLFSKQTLMRSTPKSRQTRRRLFTNRNTHLVIQRGLKNERQANTFVNPCQSTRSILARGAGDSKRTIDRSPIERWRSLWPITSSRWVSVT